MFSIVILTYNEESSIQSCLESINWCDDIVIIDSYSQDQTLEIGEKFGARVYKNEFVDFAQQRNFANEEIKFKYQWVFHLDADEHFNLDLKKECEVAIKKYEYGAFMVPSKTMLYDKWIKYAANYPVYQMRFHKIGDSRFIQHGHGQRETDLRKGLGFLTTPYEHFSYAKGITNWLQKHVKYAEEEAYQFYQDNEKIKIKNLFSKNTIEQRRAIKRISATLPFRPVLRFLYFYIIKMGFRDGRIGYEYCKLQYLFELMVVFKSFEIRQKNKGIIS
ncbi:glycosyltransferase family 2 protein [Winogradskyella rapida]|uniref:Glycosyltransferase family 2 protein n=1 Tax=Winogradskyella rapida TaxID=549701 RepID=A0ABW3KR84_9FLAO